MYPAESMRRTLDIVMTVDCTRFVKLNNLKTHGLIYAKISIFLALKYYVLTLNEQF